MYYYQGCALQEIFWTPVLWKNWGAQHKLRFDPKPHLHALKKSARHTKFLALCRQF